MKICVCSESYFWLLALFGDQVCSNKHQFSEKSCAIKTQNHLNGIQIPPWTGPEIFFIALILLSSQLIYLSLALFSEPSCFFMLSDFFFPLMIFSPFSVRILPPSPPVFYAVVMALIFLSKNYSYFFLAPIIYYLSFYLMPVPICFILWLCFTDV